MVTYYRSGPIERDPDASFHTQNQVDEFLIKEGFEIIGDPFEYLKEKGCPQVEYGVKLKRLRDRGLIYEYSEKELLLIMSLRKVRQAAFIISRPSQTASGGTTSETVMSWLKGIPKLVIIGRHHEGLLDNDSTFMLRMLTDRYGLVFDTENDVIDFIRNHIEIFRKGRNAIRELIADIKRADHHINDRPKPLWDEKFEGKTVILYGRPGCGKDTQSRLLQRLCGFKVFGGGLELRQLGVKFPILGHSLSRGNLAPEIIINYLMASKLMKLEQFEPIVFSGSPKKIREARGLMKILTLLNRRPTVIVIEINENLSNQRIALRRNCDSCEVSYCGTKFVENPVCEQCGGPLTARSENMSREAIKKIFGWYETDVKKVIRHFANLGLVTYIGGNRGIYEIFDDIVGILKR